MKRILKNFVNGILLIVPIAAVIYVVYKMFVFFDGLLGNYLRSYMKEDYIPGIGIILTILSITLIGWLSTQFILGSLFRFIDRILSKIPIVKTIYSVIKDTVHSFLGEKKSFSKVVLIKQPNSHLTSVGFITSENVGDFYNEYKEYVAVYIPQTFQVAGFTFLVPKDQVTVIEVKAEDAMKFVLSGGMTSK
ncbi:DUF502 domain-containing protein [Peribacillus acanthi]|uniref:DUF502 domain-containing protein n=1 Tax=Peribacillus acanthi TaxID=2171554 RepID=UPI000D3E37BE|nr:DUF502 domain-containing protein [Peribacillus acanthi]